MFSYLKQLLGLLLLRADYFVSKNYIIKSFILIINMIKYLCMKRILLMSLNWCNYCFIILIFYFTNLLNNNSKYYIKK